MTIELKYEFEYILGADDKAHYDVEYTYEAEITVNDLIVYFIGKDKYKEFSTEKKEGVKETFKELLNDGILEALENDDWFIEFITERKRNLALNECSETYY